MAFEVEDVHDAFPYWLVFKCLANGHGLSERGRSAVLEDSIGLRNSTVSASFIFISPNAKYLDGSGSVPEAEMAALEWAYLPLFRFSDRHPRALQNALSSSPRFFVEVLCALYRPTKESGIEELVPADPERASAIASQAHDLFHAWRRLPGTTEDNVLDAGALEKLDKRGTEAFCRGRARTGR